MRNVCEHIADIRTTDWIYRSVATLFLLVFFGCGDADDFLHSAVVLNPSGMAPLSAMVTFSTRIPGTIRMVVRGKHGPRSNVEHSFDEFGYNHEIAVHGLYPDYENTVDIELLDDHGRVSGTGSLKITTDSLPDDMPTSITVDVRQDAKMEEGFNLLSYFGASSPQIPLIVDNDGEIRWLLNYQHHAQLSTLYYDMGVERLADGNLYFADEQTSTIYEVDLFGNILNSWALTGYNFHHNVQEKPNGNFLVTVSKPGSFHLNGNPTIEDYVIELDRQSGGVIREWDLKQSLDENRVALVNNLTKNPIDWIHVNAVIYDPSDDTIIISGRAQGLIKLTNDNRVRWILGPHKGWGVNRRGEDLNAFLLTPLDARGVEITDPLVRNGDVNHPEFEWNWFQHAPLIKDDGNIMLFDNGTSRNFNPAALERYSRAVEYRIDSQTMTVEQVWTYGKERGRETYSAYVSDVDFFPGSQRVLFCPGYQVENTRGKGGKVVEIDYNTKEIVFQMSVSSQSLWGFPRAERMNIYP